MERYRCLYKLEAVQKFKDDFSLMGLKLYDELPNIVELGSRIEQTKTILEVASGLQNCNALMYSNYTNIFGETFKNQHYLGQFAHTNYLYNFLFVLSSITAWNSLDVSQARLSASSPVCTYSSGSFFLQGRDSMCAHDGE